MKVTHEGVLKMQSPTYEQGPASRRIRGFSVQVPEPLGHGALPARRPLRLVDLAAPPAPPALRIRHERRGGPSSSSSSSAVQGPQWVPIGSGRAQLRAQRRRGPGFGRTTRGA